MNEQIYIIILISLLILIGIGIFLFGGVFGAQNETKRIMVITAMELECDQNQTICEVISTNTKSVELPPKSTNKHIPCIGLSPCIAA